MFDFYILIYFIHHQSIEQVVLHFFCWLLHPNMYSMVVQKFWQIWQIQMFQIHKQLLRCKIQCSRLGLSVDHQSDIQQELGLGSHKYLQLYPLLLLGFQHNLERAQAHWHCTLEKHNLIDIIWIGLKNYMKTLSVTAIQPIWKEIVLGFDSLVFFVLWTHRENEYLYFF